MARSKRKGRIPSVKVAVQCDRDQMIQRNRDWFVAKFLHLKAMPPDWIERVRHATRYQGLTVEVLKDALFEWDRSGLPDPLRLLALSFKDPEAFEAERLARISGKKPKRRKKASKSGASRSLSVQTGPRIQLADRCRFCQGELPATPLTRNGHREKGVCAHCIWQVPPRPIKEPRERREGVGKSVWAKASGWKRNSAHHKHK